MRSALLSIMLLFSVLQTRAQNLVPNWSFEEISSCPQYQGDIENAIGWLTFRGEYSCDLYHVCGHPDSCGVPINFAGEQLPSSGQAYAGIHTFSADDAWPWYTREWVGAQLTTPLVVGATYHATFKVSLTLGWGTGAPLFERCRFANDRTGLFFTMSQWLQDDFDPVPGYAHVFGTEVVEDTVGWTLISGSFVADSAYQYVVVGNFFSDEETNWSLMDPNGTGYLAYYYIDDVCVSPNPQYCAIASGLAIRPGQGFRVWSDLSSGTLNAAGIQGLGVERISVVDAIGRSVAQPLAVTGSDSWSVSVSTWASGAYIVVVELDDGSRIAERVFLGR
ncbi:MAG: T9SS type A sorting domain-containing protein [Flavobacteriales bacterium]|nr:T9SS type A sorting domain-containing protein [Flavobacteriales bacterium]